MLIKKKKIVLYTWLSFLGILIIVFLSLKDKVPEFEIVANTLIFIFFVTWAIAETHEKIKFNKLSKMKRDLERMQKKQNDKANEEKTD